MAFYDEPFDPKDLTGQFEWTADFASRFSPSTLVRHACHEEDVRTSLLADEVTLRSICMAKLPTGEKRQFRCLWAALNSFSAYGNHFGPFIVAAPIRRLVGRKFYVFQQRDKRPLRNVFFQYVDGQELYPDTPLIDDPDRFFEKGDNGKLDRTWDDFFYFALRWPVNLVGAALLPEKHDHCIGPRCSGMTEDRAEQWIAANRSLDVHSILDWSAA